MRTLTILRRKSFVGSAGTMKVYIEDPLVNDLTINGVSCRKLGNLKNGQQTDFLIGEEAARVYVVADKLSKSFSNDFYPIPAGTEPVFLSGKNRYNPFAGNPYYFDNVTDETVLANRKRTKRKAWLVMLIALLVGFAVGFLATGSLFGGSAEPKTFSAQGMEITLTDEFRETEMEGFDVCYDSTHAAVFCLKEPFSLMEGFEDYTLEEYGELVIQSNGFEGSAELQTADGLTYFSYNSDVDGQVYSYYAVVYKADDSFWLIQFTALQEDLPDYQDSFVQWAKSVSFS